MGEMGSALRLTHDDSLDRTATAHHIERCVGRERLAGEEIRHLLEQTKNHRNGRCNQRDNHESNYVAVWRPMEETSKADGMLPCVASLATQRANSVAHGRRFSSRAQVSYISSTRIRNLDPRLPP